MSLENYNILIVDDDLEVHKDMRFALRAHYIFDGAHTEEKLREKLSQRSVVYDLILLDLVLDESGEKVGMNWIAEINKKFPQIPIVVITSDDSVQTVVQAMQEGAVDYLHKGDVDYDLWEEKFRKIIEERKKAAESVVLKADLKRFKDKEKREHSFIGESPKVLEIKKLLRIVAEEPDVTVLITGETGVGKEVAARYMHRFGPRKDRPFYAINLSAFSEELLESELFGHIKGAFTGASKDKEGYFRQANTGILMLDEIGDIQAELQIKLLRLLEQKVVRPVGSDKDIQLDVQIVAATHRNLKEEIEKGNFRLDLYQRLKNVEVCIPPLRERREDIPLIIEHYLSQKYNFTSEVISKEVMDKLMTYSFPGNVRELTNAMDFMFLQKRLQKKDFIDFDCLPADMLTSAAPSLVATTPEASPQPSYGSNGNGWGNINGISLKKISEDEPVAILHLEKIESVLQVKNKVKGDAAVALGLRNADDLRYRVKEYFKRFPHLFERFPLIREVYRRIVSA